MGMGMGMVAHGHRAPVHTFGIVVVAVVGVFVWLLAALLLGLAQTYWNARWTRVAHIAVSVAILGALAFGIYRLILAVPADGCGSSPARKTSCSLGQGRSAGQYGPPRKHRLSYGSPAPPLPVKPPPTRSPPRP